MLIGAGIMSATLGAVLKELEPSLSITIFETLEEAQDILDLVTRHWNTIAGTLYKGRVYFPFLLEDEHGQAQGNDWAKGFLRGMGLRRRGTAC